MADNPRDDRLESKIDKLLEKVAKLEALAATESDRCPFRERISKAANNATRLEKAEKAVEGMAERLTARIEANASSIQLLKLNWAKLFGLMVGAGAAGGVIADGLAKLIGS